MEGRGDRVREIGRVVASILIALAIGITAILAHQDPFRRPERPVGAQPPASPALAMTTAATILEDKTAKGGPGFTFEIVQRSTMHAKPGGPQIEIPDPSDPHKSLGFADTYELGALIERGAVTPDGFTMEMRTGPAPGKPADWKAAYQFGVTAAAGKLFRNDGAGWYATSDPPGIGLDPATAALLPSLLRNATDPPTRASPWSAVSSCRRSRPRPRSLMSRASSPSTALRSPSSSECSSSRSTTRVSSPSSTSSRGTQT